MILDFESISNARELGGFIAADGRRVRQNVLLRTAHLARASDRDLRQLSQEFHVRHVFDFRDAAECARSPDRPIDGAAFHHLPVLNVLPGSSNEDYRAAGPEGVRQLFLGMYAAMSGDAYTAGQYAHFFRTLSSGSGEAVLFHCTQGKDRTGVAALLLLSALGVSEADALEDYFRTNDFMARRFQEKIDAGLSERDQPFMRMVLFVMPECLDAFLSGIRQRWGGTEGYLRGALGLTDADFRALRKNYTE